MKENVSAVQYKFDCLTGENNLHEVLSFLFNGASFRIIKMEIDDIITEITFNIGEHGDSTILLHNFYYYVSSEKENINCEPMSPREFEEKYGKENMS